MHPGTNDRGGSAALLLLRVALGGLMLVRHGWGKTMKVMEGNFDFADPIGIGEAPSLVLAAAGETIAPLLLVFGFATRLAAVPAAFTMFVAAFVVHGGDPFAKKELAIVYLVGFVALMLGGGGRHSLDARLRRR